MEKYEQGFSVSAIFKDFNSGIQTKNDKLSIQFTKKNLENIVNDFKELEIDELKNKYKLKDTSGWNVLNAKNDLLNNKIFFTQKNYRPFDIKFTLYTGKSSGFIGRPRTKESKHMINNNLSLITCRNQNFETLGFVSKYISDMRTFSNPGSIGTDYFFPLYLYQENKDNLLGEEQVEKIPNLDGEIILKIEQKLGMSFVYSVDGDYSDIKGDYFSPEDLFDYIYSVLHSKSYRKTYKEFLKIDFPKVPFDVKKETFFKMVKLGRELKSYHLLENESLIPKNFITKYPVDGDNLVEKIKYDDEKVFINDEQYFEGIPENVWNFYIGGYQPAQKWLKDRKGRELGYEDIIHYGKMIVSLNETIRIMEEIEGVFKA